MLRRQVASALALTCLVPPRVQAQARAPVPSGRPATSEKTMQLRISWGQESLRVKLETNRSAEDLRSLLPLTLSLEDYAGTEKVAYLPRRLSTADVPDGIEPRAGDLAYYAPWGNLALYYRDFRYSPGLIRLGKIVTPLDVLRFKTSVQARFELVEA